MSNLASGSSATEDNFLEFDEVVEDSENIDNTVTASENIDDNDSDTDPVDSHTSFLDARRRLEIRIAERNLEKDLKEFHFDI